MGRKKYGIPIEKQKKPYHSITYGRLTENNMFEILGERLKTSKFNCILFVGTDSQTFSGTKVISVIAVHEVGHGGFFFNTVDWTKRYGKKNLQEKIAEETRRSIELGKKVLNFIQENKIVCDIKIHADIGRGKYSKTEEMINWVVPMIEAEGFEAEVKPNSWCASTIADRISK
jgi:predicted RNase H-related nuclease YkuK (DUF458 family)